MARIDDLEAENAALKAKLVEERINDAFSRSKFVAERLLVPADMLCKRFGGSFTVENDRVVGQDADGNRILSRSVPGDLASFDEALEVLVRAYPHRDRIMRATHQGGGQGGNGAAGKTITREVWNQLSPLEQREALIGQGLRLTN